MVGEGVSVETERGWIEDMELAWRQNHGINSPSLLFQGRTVFVDARIATASSDEHLATKERG